MNLIDSCSGTTLWRRWPSPGQSDVFGSMGSQSGWKNWRPMVSTFGLLIWHVTLYFWCGLRTRLPIRSWPYYVRHVINWIFHEIQSLAGTQLTDYDTGQNMFRSPSKVAHWRKALEWWDNEKAHFDYYTDTCKLAMECGHYTQVRLTQQPMRSHDIGCPKKSFSIKVKEKVHWKRKLTWQRAENLVHD